MGILGKIWIWFQGKKTILGGLVILAAAVAGVWYGHLDPVTGVAVAGIGLSVAGGGDKANRHQAELLAALQGVAKVGEDVRSGNGQQGIQDAQATAAALAPAAISEALPLGLATLNITGSSAEEVASLVKSLGSTAKTSGETAK